MSNPGPKRHPANVPGDFYVEDGCCTACGVPTHTAPELFVFDDHSHCIVKKQPSSPDEVNRMMRVMRYQEFQCVRYSGTDEALQRRIGEASGPELCDARPPAGVRPVDRIRVVFEATGPEMSALSGEQLLQRLAQSLGASGRIRTTAVRGLLGTPKLRVAWTDVHHTIVIAREGGRSERWLLSHDGPAPLSDDIDDWLRSESGVSGIHWYSKAEWRAKSGGRERPY